MPDPVPATTPAPTTTPAAKPPAVIVPPAPDAKPGEPAAPVSPAKAARNRLDEMTKLRREAAADVAEANRLKAELAPRLTKAEEYEADRKLAAEDPAAWAEKHGIDRNAMTEKLAARAIEDVKAKTPDGRIDELKKELDEFKTEKQKNADAIAQAEQAKQVKAFQATLVTAASDATKFPLTARAAKIEFGDDLPNYLWEVGRRIFVARTEGMSDAEKNKQPAPTPEEIATAVEKRYADLAKGLVPEPPAPAKQKTAAELKAEAEERAKAKKEKPTTEIKKAATTMAERRAALRAKK